MWTRFEFGMQVVEIAEYLAELPAQGHEQGAELASLDKELGSINNRTSRVEKCLHLTLRKK